MIARIVWVLGIFLCFLLGWFVYVIIPSQVLDPSPEGEETPRLILGLWKLDSKYTELMAVQAVIRR
ncbi:hypothetical protein kam1_363 [Methylacidiphilum kamchatkense Kam1]|uniref:Uncharacterized protein n=1 Tax=Methylacidiphilum kamchatkense Kam1 TaxID=1202785 RepID=A0A516TKA9_9BACT|nr:hypothetical protein kam1_363 [Methylacidiphilum kamchatkense Kam1]